MAVTVAALACAAAYLVFDVRPEQISEYFPQLAKEGQGKRNQALESRVTDHQSDVKNSEVPPTEAKFEVPETKPQGFEESNSVVEVSFLLVFYIFNGLFFNDFIRHSFLGF